MGFESVTDAVAEQEYSRAGLYWRSEQFVGEWIELRRGVILSQDGE